jgi:hypothetical protein
VAGDSSTAFQNPRGATRESSHAAAFALAVWRFDAALHHTACGFPAHSSRTAGRAGRGGQATACDPGACSTPNSCSGEASWPGAVGVMAGRAMEARWQQGTVTRAGRPAETVKPGTAQLTRATPSAAIAAEVSGLHGGCARGCSLAQRTGSPAENRHRWTLPASRAMGPCDALGLCRIRLPRHGKERLGSAPCTSLWHPSKLPFSSCSISESPQQFAVVLYGQVQRELQLYDQRPVPSPSHRPTARGPRRSISCGAIGGLARNTCSKV